MNLRDTQRGLYWSRIRESFESFRRRSGRRIDLGDFRARVHRAALGRDKSLKDFTGRDLTRVLAELDTIDTLAAPLSETRRKLDQPRLGVLRAIDRLGLPGPFIERIAGECFRITGNAWRHLSEGELQRLLRRLRKHEHGRQQA